MKDAQVIIFDLDGTAVDSPRQKTPSDRLATAIQGIKGTHRAVETKCFRRV